MLFLLSQRRPLSAISHRAANKPFPRSLGVRDRPQHRALRSCTKAVGSGRTEAGRARGARRRLLPRGELQARRPPRSSASPARPGRRSCGESVGTRAPLLPAASRPPSILRRGRRWLRAPSSLSRGRRGPAASQPEVPPERRRLPWRWSCWSGSPPRRCSSGASWTGRRRRRTPCAPCGGGRRRAAAAGSGRRGRRGWSRPRLS